MGNWKAKTLWETHNGKIPYNHIIHHIDGNHDNNVIDNLQMMTMAEHARLHHTGLKHSEEWNENIRQGNLGIKRSAHVRKNMSIGQTGKKYSEETKAKKSAIAKKNFTKPEYRKAQSERMTEWWANRRLKKLEVLE